MSAPSDAIEGTVTDIKKVRRRSGRVAVYVDGMFAMELDASLASEHGVVRGFPLSGSICAMLRKADSRRTALNKALDFLSYRSRTEEEIRKKLRDAGCEDEVIGATVERLGTLGYLDDERFARDFVTSRIVRRSHGPLRVRRDLFRLGIDESVVEAAIAEVASRETLLDSAISIGMKYVARLDRERDDRKRRWKFVQYLLRRGFPADIAGEAVERVIRDRNPDR